MSVSDIISYDKNGNAEPVGLWGLYKKLFIPIVIILVATLSFGVGRLSVVGEREQVKIEYNQSLSSNTEETVIDTSETATAIKSVSKALSESTVVVSKNGTKYHFLYCPGAKQIKEANKITFATPDDAENAGYTIAANCKQK